MSRAIIVCGVAAKVDPGVRYQTSGQGARRGYSGRQQAPSEAQEPIVDYNNLTPATRLDNTISG